MLEAGDRVGGRVWSERLANGSIIERGAEFVLPGYETMRDARRAARAHVPREGDALRRPRPARRSTGHARRPARGGCPASRCERRDARRGDRQPSGDRRRTQRDRLAARHLDCARAARPAGVDPGRRRRGLRWLSKPRHRRRQRPNRTRPRGFARRAVRPPRRADRVERRRRRRGRRVGRGVRRRDTGACGSVRPAATRVEAARARRGSLRRGGEALPAARARGRAERDAVGSRPFLDVDRARLACRRLVRRHQRRARCVSTSRTGRSAGRLRSVGSGPTFPSRTPRPSSRRGPAVRTRRARSRHRSTTRLSPAMSARSRLPASTPRASGTG